MESAKTIIIRNMVCPRCIASVRQVFEQAGIPVRSIELGLVTTERVVSDDEMPGISKSLSDLGFEVSERRVNLIVGKIKNAVADYLSRAGERPRPKLSTLITEQIPYDYSYLSDTFSGIEGKSIEQYFIELRIEKVKELIVYDQLNLSEIAHVTGFSSVHHLSAQFKKVTGLTPSHFKKIGARRKSLDAL